MNEKIQLLTHADVKKSLVRIKPQSSYSDQIAEKLGEVVFGQPEACQAVARRIALFETGLADPNRPLGSFFELGPRGCGKTEMAHALAKYLFDDPYSDRLKIVNMAEMTERHYITRFTGSPPSYVGHNEKPEIEHEWLHKGRSIVLIDEFEKAHHEIKQLWLGVLDKGTLNARKGTEGIQALRFNNSVIMFTANIAGKEIQEINGDGIPFGIGAKPKTDGQKEQAINKIVKERMKEQLSPEFIDRIDEVVIFKEIKERSIHDQILTKFIDERNNYLKESLEEMAPYFAVTKEFRDHILDQVGNEGGRSIKRELDKELFNNAANVFVGCDIAGKPLVADYDTDEGGVVFYTDEITCYEDESEDSIKQIRSDDQNGDSLQIAA